MVADDDGFYHAQKKICISKKGQGHSSGAEPALRMRSWLQSSAELPATELSSGGLAHCLEMNKPLAGLT